MNITQKERDHIQFVFPNLSEALYEYNFDEHGYQNLSISVFDHVLNRDEFDRYFYTEDDEIRERQNKFKTLLVSLNASVPMYIAKFRRDRRQNLVIKRVRDTHHLEKLCQFRVLDEQYGDYFRFVIPDLGIIYTQGFDWTHHVHFLDETKLNDFKKLVKAAKLFII